MAVKALRVTEISPNMLRPGSRISTAAGRYATVKEIERPCDRTHVHVKMDNGKTFCYDMAGKAEVIL